jgi:histone deacetylase 1/2
MAFALFQFSQLAHVWNQAGLVATLNQMHLHDQQPWVMHSGASSQMSSSDGILLSCHPSSNSSITVGNGHTLPISCRGESILHTPVSNFPLRNVLVVPSLVNNLLSVRQFTKDNNCSIEFDALGFSVKDIQTRRVMLRCNSADDLYTIPTTPPTPHASIAISTDLWHHRLGHPSSATIDILPHSVSISCNKVAHTLCHSCQLGKHVWLSFSNSSSFSTMPFELVHCDVWTSPIAGILGFQYYLVLLDDFTHFCWTFPLVRKSEVAAHC